MKNIRVYYANIENFGDLLNVNIIEKCFNMKVIHSTCLTAKLSGIGSGLKFYTLSGNINNKIVKILSNLFISKIYIWGTGFNENEKKDAPFYKMQTKICSLRGELTKIRVEKILGHKIDVPVGDGGILASYLLDEIPSKKYDVGIIPHHREQDEPVFNDLINRFPNSTLIDVKKEPIDVVRKIAECKVVISSSLHGLIVADSFNIPNCHIVVSNKPLGDGFKFDDYYSAYGLKHEYIDTRIDAIDSLDQIIDNYKITSEMVEDMKKRMIDAFPLFNDN